MIEVREERREDIGAIREVNRRAFGQTAEASIVDALREHCPGFLSLVAVEGGRIFGHILFSPVVIECEGRNVSGMGLAPMSVLPECQRRGIGSAMVMYSNRSLITQQAMGNALAPGFNEAA